MIEQLKPVAIAPDAVAERIIEIVTTDPTVDVQTSEWYEEIGDHPLAGTCYQVSECYLHAVSDKRREKLTPMQVSFDAVYQNTMVECSHWFLESDDRIIDLTAEQFTDYGVRIPYDEARGRGFLTAEPSSDTQQILDRLDQ